MSNDLIAIYAYQASMPDGVIPAKDIVTLSTVASPGMQPIGYLLSPKAAEKYQEFKPEKES